MRPMRVSGHSMPLPESTTAAMNPELEKVQALGVSLHGRRIGIINRLAGDRHIFAFEQDYLDDPHRPTLSLSYKGREGGVVTAVRSVGRRLPPYFSNLLPEGRLWDYLNLKVARSRPLVHLVSSSLPI